MGRPKRRLLAPQRMVFGKVSDVVMAGSISAMRVEEIRETGAEIVVSACQQCEQMLSAAIRKAGLKVRVMDISQLILEALG